MAEQAARWSPEASEPGRGVVPSTTGRAPAGPAIVAYVLGLAALAALVLRANSGVFSYSLDDPYIHLEFARHLSQGQHGIHAGEFSAPSSSILWPVLLAPAWWIGGAFWAPLALNVASGLLAIAGFAAAVRRVLDASVPAWMGGALVVGLVGIGNLLALTFTGMEHTLQVAATAWLAVALMDVDAGRAPARWLPVPALVLPLLRFECTGIVLLAAAWLAWRGHRRLGVGLGVAVVALLASYAGFLYARSGFWLPFSVLSKNAMFARAWQQAYAPAVFVPVLLAGAMLWRQRGRALQERLLPAIAAAGVVGHVLIAQVGLFHRYLGYVTIFLVLMLAWSERSTLRAELAAGGARARIVGWCVLIVAAVNGHITTKVVGYAEHIWRQQGQLARLTTLLDGPVAVNDIGWVSLASDHYVLDLVGLASAEALQHQLAGDPATWMDDLAREKGVRAVMIFPHWFQELPPSWVHVGTLVVDQTGIPGADRFVVVLAPDAASAPSLRDTLTRFAPTLPEGVRLLVEHGS